MSVGVCEECGTETEVRYWEGALMCQECAEAMNGGPVRPFRFTLSAYQE